eukprot:5590142-Prymnesium_polylepis.2
MCSRAICRVRAHARQHRTYDVDVDVDVDVHAHVHGHVHVNSPPPKRHPCCSPEKLKQGLRRTPEEHRCQANPANSI